MIDVDLLNSKQLRKRLNVSYQTIINWRKDGMPCIKIGYNMIRFNLSEVMQWLETRNKGLKNEQISEAPGASILPG